MTTFNEDKSQVGNILQNEFSSHRLVHLTLKFMQTRIDAFSITRMLSFISQHTPDAKKQNNNNNSNNNKKKKKKKKKLGNCIARALRPYPQKRCINRLVDEKAGFNGIINKNLFESRR